MASELPAPFTSDSSDSRGGSRSDAGLVGIAGESRGRETQTSLRLQRGFRSDSQRRAVLDWLTDGLRADRPGRLEREYPLVLDPMRDARHFTLFQQERPLAHCVLWPRAFPLRGARLRTALLSLVFSDPAARGRGHARRVVRAAVEHARQSAECGLVLLWSEADALYAREGFEPGGSEALLVLDDATLERALERWHSDPPDLSGSGAPASSTAVRPARPRDLAAIARLRSRRAVGTSLTEVDLRCLGDLPDLEIRVAHRGDRVVAFAMRGRGDDLQEVIHDWGGETEGVIRCARALLGERGPGARLCLLAPPIRSQTVWCLRQAGARRIPRPLAWIRLASLDALRADLSRVRGAEALNGLVEGEQRDTAAPCFHWPMRPERGRIAQSELLELLFGPAGAFSPRVAGSDRSTSSEHARRASLGDPDTLEPALPLPLFVWGLESI